MKRIDPWAVSQNGAEFTPCGGCHHGYCACPQACIQPEEGVPEPSKWVRLYVAVVALAAICTAIVSYFDQV